MRAAEREGSEAEEAAPAAAATSDASPGAPPCAPLWAPIVKKKLRPMPMPTLPPVPPMPFTGGWAQMSAAGMGPSGLTEERIKEQRWRTEARLKEASDLAVAHKFEEAHAAYTEVLGLPSEALPLDWATGNFGAGKRAFYLANRSHVRIMLDLGVGALEDADEALALGDFRPVVYFRKVQALEKLGRHAEAKV